MARRLVVPAGSLASGALELDADLSHYVATVLRLGEGAALALFDGDGATAPATVTRVDKRRVGVEVGAVTRHPRPAPELVLLQAVGKGDKMDQVVRQATELGAQRVVPVLTERAVARQDKRVARWRTIAEDAVRVAAHPFRPHVAEVTSLAAALAEPPGLGVVLALDAAAPLKDSLQGRPERITVLVGPEGGLTAGEVDAARAAGFAAAHLGPRTLRTETAGPAVLAVVAHWAGRYDTA